MKYKKTLGPALHNFITLGLLLSSSYIGPWPALTYIFSDSVLFQLKTRSSNSNKDSKLLKLSFSCYYQQKFFNSYIKFFKENLYKNMNPAYLNEKNKTNTQYLVEICLTQYMIYFASDLALLHLEKLNTASKEVSEELILFTTTRADTKQNLETISPPVLEMYKDIVALIQKQLEVDEMPLRFMLLDNKVIDQYNPLLLTELHSYTLTPADKRYFKNALTYKADNITIFKNRLKSAFCLNNENFYNHLPLSNLKKSVQLHSDKNDNTTSINPNKSLQNTDYLKKIFSSNPLEDVELIIAYLERIRPVLCLAAQDLVSEVNLSLKEREELKNMIGSQNSILGQEKKTLKI